LRFLKLIFPITIFLLHIKQPIPVAVRSEEFCNRLIAGIAVSNLAEAMNVRLLCCALCR